MGGGPANHVHGEVEERPQNRLLESIPGLKNADAKE
jgi:hypothetical protein